MGRRNIEYSNRINQHDIDDNESLALNNKEKNKLKIKLFIWIILTILVGYQVYTMITYTLGTRDKEKMWLYNSANSFLGLFITKSPNQTIENNTLKVAALGDIYVTSNTLSGAKNGSKYDFNAGLDDVSDKLKEYDLVIASLNTPVADTLPYSSKNIYNSPIELLDTLKKLNISVVATANEHSMDKNENGIIQTEKALKDKEVSQIGISSEKRNDPIVITKNNISIGILSYTTDTNISVKTNKKYLVNIFDENDIKKDVEYLESKNVDYIISYLYVPNENSTITNSKQKECVDKLFNNGVNVVLGTGSNAVQDTEEDLIKVNDKDTHVYAAYGLGDFMGTYGVEDNRISTIVNIEFTKDITKNKKGEVLNTSTDMKVKDPIGVWTKITTKYVKTMYLTNNEIEKYNNDTSKLTVKEYNELKKSNDRIIELFK